MSSILDIIKTFFNNFNLIDFFVAIAILAYIIEGYSVGFLAGFIDLFTFFLSIILSFKLYPFLASLILKLHISMQFSNIISFIILVVILELIIRTIVVNIYRRSKVEVALSNNYSLYKLNQILGSLTGILSALILISILLTAFIILPISQPIKNSISNSFFGMNLIPTLQRLDNYLASNTNDSSLLYLSVEPNQTTVQNLGFTYSNFTENLEDEKSMLQMLNDQRIQNGLSPLISDNSLKQVALLHGEDMLKNGYFSHNDLNGRTFNQRFSDNEIEYSFAGENLAFAPNVSAAMNGLLASPGHRANILSTNFKKVGIVVLNAGVYGEMFVQDFTD